MGDELSVTVRRERGVAISNVADVPFKLPDDGKLSRDVRAAGSETPTAACAEVGPDVFHLFPAEHALPRRHPFVDHAVGRLLDEHVVSD